MVKISFLRPTDQPIDKQRLLQELKTCLDSTEYTHFRFAVAFAKMGALLRLLPNFEKWRSSKKTIEGIFGIDNLGTSRQALEIALANLDSVYITHMGGRVTFHPKLYLFWGNHHAVCFYGSHNLTVGGTETNYEGGVKIELDRPSDEMTFAEALDCWQSLLPEYHSSTRLLDSSLLDELSNAGLLLDEEIKSSPAKVPSSVHIPLSSDPARRLFPRIYAKPPSPIPVSSIAKITTAPSRGSEKTIPPPISLKVAPAISQTFVIEIDPQENGEVYLSKRALDQNQEFFDYPFTGWSHPRIPGNDPYPQREPDPLVGQLPNAAAM